MDQTIGNSTRSAQIAAKSPETFLQLLTNKNPRDIDEWYDWAQGQLTSTEIDWIRESVPVIGLGRKDGTLAKNAVLSALLLLPTTSDHTPTRSTDNLLAMILTLCRYMGTSCWFEEERPVSISVVYRPSCGYSQSLLSQLRQDKLPFVSITKDQWEKDHGTSFPYATVPQIKVDGIVIDGGYNGYMQHFHTEDYTPERKNSVKGTALAAGLTLVALFYLSKAPGDPKMLNFGHDECRQLGQIGIAVSELIKGVQSKSTHDMAHQDTPDRRMYIQLYQLWLKWIQQGRTQAHEYIRSFINILVQCKCVPDLPTFW